MVNRVNPLDMTQMERGPCAFRLVCGHLWLPNELRSSEPQWTAAMEGDSISEWIWYRLCPWLCSSTRLCWSLTSKLCLPLLGPGHWHELQSLALFQLAITSSLYIVSQLSFFFSCFSCVSLLFSFVDPHLHCQHLMASVTSYLNAPGKQLGRKEGRKEGNECVCLCIVCDLAEGHEQVTGSGYNPPFWCQIYPCVHGCALHTCTCVLCIHAGVGACVQCIHERMCVCVCVCVWTCDGVRTWAAAVGMLLHS